MAITPYSTPLKTEYKPLGLEAFAKPFSEMQAKFDTTMAELDASDFALSRLTQDDDRAKEVLEQFKTDRDALAENLVTTGDYRSATRQLSKLNQKFNKDLEVGAIKGNYEQYQAAKKEQLERVKSGKLTQRDYDIWDFNTRHRFKGTNFNPQDENYTSINTHPLTDNYEDEIRKEALQIAGMAPDQQVTYLKSLGMSDAFTEEKLKEVVTYKDRDQVAGEIERFLRTSKKYNQFVQERADEEFYYNNARDPKFKENVIDNGYEQLQNEFNAYSQIAQNTKLPTEQRNQAAQKAKEKEVVLNNYQRDFAEAQNKGTVDEFAQMIYRKNADKTFGLLGYTGADIVDRTKVDKYVSESVDEAAKASADASIKLLDEIGRVSTNSVPGLNNKQGITITGTATASTDEFVINNKKAALETLNSISLTQVPGMSDIDKKLTLVPRGPLRVEIDKVAGTNRDLYGSLMRMNNFNEAISDQDAQVKTLQQKLSSAKTKEEKEMYSQQITNLVQNKEETRLALADDTRTLENLIKIEMNKGDVSPEFKELYNSTFAKGDTQGFLRSLRGEVNKFVDRQATEIGSTGRVLKENDFVTFANNVTRNYRANIQSTFMGIGQEVILDEAASKLTDGKTAGLIKYVKENTRGDSQVRHVEFNVLTGKSQVKDENRFDLSAYSETPHWSGVDQNGDVILRYVLKPEYDPATKKSNGPVASYIKKEKGLPEDSPIAPTQQELAAWYKANPTDLYIKVSNTSLNPHKSAENNYVKIGSAGVAYNNSDVILRNLQNYAPVHILQNAERRESYFKMASRLEDAMKNNYLATELIQAPAAWKNNNNGTYTGYSINYKVVDGQTIAMVNQGTLNSNLKVTWNETPIATVALSSMGQNLTTALVAMDLMYGTGREEDLVQAPSAGMQIEPFVPAFLNPGVARMSGQSPTR